MGAARILETAARIEARASGRVERTTAVLRDAAARAGMHVTADDRVSEQDLARLMNWSAGTLANRRRTGEAPPSYRIGGARFRVSYRLEEVAEWIECRREMDANSRNGTQRNPTNPNGS